MQTATDSLATKREAYEQAYVAFKRHEAWGWHLFAPFAEGASEEERATLQAGMDRYNELHAELERAKPVSYNVLMKDHWRSKNTTYSAVIRKFRRFHVKDGLATFIVAKDGANYENLSMNVEELLVPGLKLWASILQVPYASRMVRAELETMLQPVLDVLARGPVPRR